MYSVTTDHQVSAVGFDLMKLSDCQTGATIAMASRVPGGWAVNDDESVLPSRAAAITALTEVALETLGGVGYSTLVPSDLAGLP